MKNKEERAFKPMRSWAIVIDGELSEALWPNRSLAHAVAQAGRRRDGMPRKVVRVEVRPVSDQ